MSGPGGTLWGANAVNGVINIITKSSQETQGLYASGAVGTYLRKKGTLRYGGKIGSDISYRIYAQHSGRNHTFLPDGTESDDKWKMTQSGFRMDWNPSEANSLMFQGNFYGGREQTEPKVTTLDGQNVLGRWTSNFSKSQLVVQAYFDRTWRRMPTIGFELKTYDFEIHHRFPLGKRHSIIMGIGYRLMQDETHNYTTFGGILPNFRRMDLFNAFLQDEIIVVPDLLKFTIGTKLLHNVFTKFELQPSVRLALTPNEQHTLWSAISRSVRMPSRIDVDYFIPTTPLPPDQPQVAGGPNFISEKVIAYELGYRVQPSSRLTVSLATFYNQYDDLYSVEALPGTQIYQIQNGTEGISWGAELSGTYQVLKQWRLRGGYTYFDKDLQNKPGRTFDYSVLGYDAQSQVLVQSMVDLPGNIQFDVTSRHLGELSNQVPDYFTFDVRVAWLFKQWEFSVNGQNLWEDRHKEWGAEIPRNIYGKVTCRF
ncbi:MAG: outer membrane beta-barrel protein [Anditalea sp.]